MRAINNRILSVVLTTLIIVLIVLAYLAGNTVARTAPTISLNSPTTFPVDI